MIVIGTLERNAEEIGKLEVIDMHVDEKLGGYFFLLFRSRKVLPGLAIQIFESCPHFVEPLIFR